ncbi:MULTISPECIES: pseudouridine synthase [unclassified Granulicatella]|uniref:pseudouridine synthase n=1 Tax=unclassified Granulicatella TaxID=2630493 RepID=UPI00107382BA|nr:MULTISPECIES: pseudouridine synthase [unclassified Granulicatella]MBF0780274.1 rRNA pseudouridine synthase [Granulicatella sp. 19428wC4_WM01]TFU95610.1 rRNA pseudouridine synthase [Granulicatella sp. WM01]
MRLDKLLESTFHYSRKTIKRLIQTKALTIDGELAKDLSQVVDANVQTILVNGKRVGHDSQVYYMLNKPSGVVSATRDSHHQTVVDLVPNHKKDVYPIGRLDRDTQGLMILTNNGPLGFKLLHPQYHVDKVYEVVVNSRLTDKDCIAFAQGIVFLDGTVCKSAKLTIISAEDNRSVARVTIAEGKFHQVKKMFLSVGKKVIFLKRIMFAGIVLDDRLEVGDYRELYHNEIRLLLSLVERNSHK